MTAYNLVNFGYDPWSSFWKRNQTMFYLLSREQFIEQAFFFNSAVWLIDLIRNPKKELTHPWLNNWKYVIPRGIDSKITAFTPMILPFSGQSGIMAAATIGLSRSCMSIYP